MKNIFSKMRPALFWAFDGLRGGKTRTHLQDLDQIFYNFQSRDVLKLIDDRMQKLFTHAVSTTAFYSELATVKTIYDFPVINKNIIRNRFEDFVSNDFKQKKLTPVLTSGSTGTPFRILHDNNKRLRAAADAVFFNKIAGYELGMKLFYIKAWKESNRKTWITRFSENIVPVDVFNLTSSENIDSLLKKIVSIRSGSCILSYPSALDSICRYIDSNKEERRKFKIKSVIAFAESLNKQSKELIERYFNVRPISRYSNMECGIIAQQKIDCNDEFYINNASFYVEILSLENDNPVPEGEPGRIVVTDYFNYAMPLIRYDTGDIGVMGDVTHGGNTLKVLTRIDGRKLDMLYDTSGKIVPPLTLTVNMAEYLDVDQYQIIQTDKGRYTIKLNCRKPFLKQRELVEEFKSFLGSDADITLHFVDEIPLISSGKRKIVISNIKDSLN